MLTSCYSLLKIRETENKGQEGFVMKENTIIILLSHLKDCTQVLGACTVNKRSTGRATGVKLVYISMFTNFNDEGFEQNIAWQLMRTC